MKLRHTRMVECPKCGIKLKERINDKFPRSPSVDFPTEFICLACGVWICGCCGTWYDLAERKGVVSLDQPHEWRKEIDALEGELLEKASREGNEVAHILLHRWIKRHEKEGTTSSAQT